MREPADLEKPSNAPGAAGQSAGKRPRLVWVGVPVRPWWKRLLLAALFLALTGATFALMAGVGLYWKFSDGLPEIPRVDEYWPPIVTEVFTDDGVLAGEFHNERRKVVAYERIPKRLVQAFIASEDASFFDHGGIDYVGTTRALFKTAMRKATGSGSVQGGSTLTQQTAKAVLISKEGYKASTEKSIKRKVREAILARRLESALTKEEILYLYLNNVYLGHHSYGVQSAAENYFRKDVRALTLAEMALIAGLPQAPSRFSPFTNPDAAKKRRGYVLRRMFEEGMISQAERQEAEQTEVRAYPVEDVFHEFAPYFTEEVRRNIVDRYGNPVLLNEGLKVFTTMDAERQRAAQDSVYWGLLAVDKRQGFRGPLAHLDKPDERAAFTARAAKAMAGESIVPGHFYVGVVTSIAADDLSALVKVGPHTGTLPLLGMRWARKLNPEAYYSGAVIHKVTQALKPWDVIIVRAVAKKEELYDDKEQYSEAAAQAVPQTGTLFRLEQEPELQSALVSIDPHRQYLTAMVGGYDFDANEFNRAFQALRQPGSGYKPLVYSAALEPAPDARMENAFTEATVIVDSPIVYDDPENETRWKPENYSQEFQGEVLVRTALVNSMNLPAIKTFIAVGIQAMEQWVKKLGLSTKMNTDFSSALGSSAVYPYELANVYATFSRMGVKKPTFFVRKIEDRFGRTVEDHTAYDDPWAGLQDRIAAGYARLYEPGERVMSLETSFIMVDLLRGVVREGTGAPAQRLGKPAAGKTGTTNDSFDAWFNGFTQDLCTTVWVGYDLNPHPLNKYETGGRAALPIWLSYMKAALAERPQAEFQPPAGADLVMKRIDNRTGKVASSGSKSVSVMWFKRDTEPEDTQPEKGQVDTTNYMLNEK